MNHLTFDQAYAALSSYAPASTEGFIQVLNEVCERFLSSGRWLGTTEIIDFDASQGRIALPKQFSTVIAAQINEAAGRIFSRYHEYVAGGPGRLSPGRGGLGMLVDEGDGFPTEKELESPSRLVVQTFNPLDAYNPLDPNTVGKMYLMGYGTDATETGANEMLELEVPLPSPSMPFVSTEVFSRITSIIKPITSGDVAIYAFGESNPLTVLGPSDTAPSYRRYKIPSANPSITSVRAVCKRRFIPLAGEKDELVVPSNLGALKLGMMAVNYENKNDLERAQDFWGKAFATLNLEMRESRGGAQMRGQIDPAAFQMNRLKNFY